MEQKGNSSDSRSNPFQEGEDDVILATLLAEAIQVLDPDADAAESELGQVLQKNVFRHLGISARTGSIKFRLKPVSTCWKDILSGYNIHEEICDQIVPEKVLKGLQSGANIQSKKRTP